ncbi:hypothetical protein ACWKWU_03040 [Chitinophaga lutea]
MIELTESSMRSIDGGRMYWTAPEAFRGAVRNFLDGLCDGFWKGLGEGLATFSGN